MNRKAVFYIGIFFWREHIRGEIIAYLTTPHYPSAPNCPIRTVRRTSGTEALRYDNHLLIIWLFFQILPFFFHNSLLQAVKEESPLYLWWSPSIFAVLPLFTCILLFPDWLTVFIEPGIGGNDVLTLGSLSAPGWSSSAIHIQGFDGDIDINCISGQSWIIKWHAMSVLNLI